MSKKFKFYIPFGTCLISTDNIKGLKDVLPSKEELQLYLISENSKMKQLGLLKPPVPYHFTPLEVKVSGDVFNGFVGQLEFKSQKKTLPIGGFNLFVSSNIKTPLIRVTKQD